MQLHNENCLICRVQLCRDRCDNTLYKSAVNRVNFSLRGVLKHQLAINHLDRRNTCHIGNLVNRCHNRPVVGIAYIMLVDIRTARLVVSYNIYINICLLYTSDAADD